MRAPRSNETAPDGADQFSEVTGIYPMCSGKAAHNGAPIETDEPAAKGDALRAAAKAKTPSPSRQNSTPQFHLGQQHRPLSPVHITVETMALYHGPWKTELNDVQVRYIEALEFFRRPVEQVSHSLGGKLSYDLDVG